MHESGAPTCLSHKKKSLSMLLDRETLRLLVVGYSRHGASRSDLKLEVLPHIEPHNSNIETGNGRCVLWRAVKILY